MLSAVQRVLVLGGSGLVGARLSALWTGQYELLTPSHADLDVLDTKALASFVSQARPEVIVNAAAWADVDAAEAERGDEHGQVFRLNAAFPGDLAALSRSLDAFLVHISTDYVFDGTSAERPYREDDPTNPVCWYAQTKARGERLVAQAGGEACIARIEMPFTAQPHRKRDFARTCLARLQAGQELFGVTDQRITPVFLDDALAMLRRVIEQRYHGTLHIAASTWTTPFEFARAIARKTGADPNAVEPEQFERFVGQRPAVRPRHSWLDVTRAEAILGPGILRSVEAQLDAWAAQLLVVTGHG
jgi:dTDP-4-dehydrorhamnose reductase